MNKKIIITITIAIIVLILGLILLFPSNNSSPNTSSSSITNNPSFFPLEKVRSIISNLPLVNEVTEQVQEIINPTETATTTKKNLNKLTTQPVADFGFISIGTTTYPYFFSQEKGQINIIKENKVELLSDYKIGNIQKGFLITDKNIHNFYLQTTSGFKWLTLPITSTSTPKLTNLNSNLLQLIPTLDKKVASLETNEGGVVVKINSPDFSTIQTIWQNPLTEWIMDSGSKSIFFQSKPTSGIKGYLYELNLTTLKIKPLISNAPGLMTKTSPDGKYSLTTISENGEITTLLYDNDPTGDLYETSFNTIPDKCVWLDNVSVFCANPKNLLSVSYPDDWYRGEIALEDNFWILKADQARAYLLIDSNDAQLKNIKIDAINLKVAPDKKSVYFINKIDSSLWRFDLSSLEL